MDVFLRHRACFTKFLVFFSSYVHSQAAKFHKEAGELFEGDLNYAKAIEHYQVN